MVPRGFSIVARSSPLTGRASGTRSVRSCLRRISFRLRTRWIRFRCPCCRAALAGGACAEAESRHSGDGPAGGRRAGADWGRPRLDLALAGVEIGTSVMLVITIGREMREMRQRREPIADGRHAHGVDWIDIWAAGVLFAEAAERWHLNHHLARPTILTGLVTLALGLFHHRLAARRQRRRAVRINPEGIYIGGKPFRTFSASWPDLASISITSSITSGAVEVRTRDGRVRRVDLGDLGNAEDVRAAFEAGHRRLAALPEGIPWRHPSPCPRRISPRPGSDPSLTPV